MVTNDSMNAHYQYMDVNRHWCPRSEKFAGGDALVTRLNDGWEVVGPVYIEEYWHAGVRMVTIYHVTVEDSHGESQVMPVLSTPYVERMLHLLELEVFPINERQRESRLQKAR